MVALRKARPLQESFMTRALRAIRRLAARMDDEDARVAVAAPSDLLSLLAALDTTEALVGIDEDPFAAARLRGIQNRQRMLAMEGGVLSADQAAQELNLTRQAVDKRRKANRLLALPMGRRGFAYPAWQFGRGGTLPGFERVMAAFDEPNPWMRAVFFLSPNPRCGEKLPIHALRRGRIDDVIRGAQAFGEHGAS